MWTQCNSNAVFLKNPSLETKIINVWFLISRLEIPEKTLPLHNQVKCFKGCPLSAVICAYLARLSACSFLNNQCKEKTHAEEIIQIQ